MKRPAIHISIWTAEAGIKRVSLTPASTFSYHINGPKLTIALFMDAYLRRERAPLPPLYWNRLTPFTRCVLETLSSLCFGETTTYGKIAAQIGRPMAARAVGQALAHLHPCSVLNY